MADIIAELDCSRRAPERSRYIADLFNHLLGESYKGICESDECDHGRVGVAGSATIPFLLNLLMLATKFGSPRVCDIAMDMLRRARWEARIYFELEVVRNPQEHSCVRSWKLVLSILTSSADMRDRFKRSSAIKFLTTISIIAGVLSILSESSAFSCLTT